ncbi:MAG: ABC transporter permease [Rhizobiaceae bacterium]|nr:ABC transporter permease [Rhizobiaceae bacterium]
MYAYSGILLAFILVPLLIIVPMSLTSGNSLAFPTPGYSLRWYQELIDDPRWFSSFVNSVVVASVSTLLSCLLGIPAAIGLAWGRFPGKRVVYAIVAAPLVAPIVIVGVAAFSFFASIGLTGSRWALILAHTALAVPIVLTTVTASLAGFDRTLVRAAASLGAGSATTFFRVILPMIAPSVISGAIMAFIISFDEVVVASFLTTGEQRTLPRMIFSGVRESISPAIASVAVLLVLLSAILLALIGWLQGRGARMRSRTAP